MTASEPALGLLSALTSLPAALCYARALGAAAVRPVRHADGRVSGLRVDAPWTRTLLLFLGGSALAAAAVAALNLAFSQLASGHAAHGVLLIAVLWPHARESIVRMLLVFLLIAAGVSRVLLGAEELASIGAGCAIGLFCAWTLRRYVGRNAFGREE